MKPIGWVLGLAIVAALGWFAYTTVDADVTQQAELPDVTVEGGQMPKAGADIGTVRVGTAQRPVQVPSLDVAPLSADPAPAN